MIKVRKNRYKDETSSCNDALFRWIWLAAFSCCGSLLLLSLVFLIRFK